MRLGGGKGSARERECGWWCGGFGYCTLIRFSRSGSSGSLFEGARGARCEGRRGERRDSTKRVGENRLDTGWIQAGYSLDWARARAGSAWGAAAARERWWGAVAGSEPGGVTSHNAARPRRQTHRLLSICPLLLNVITITHREPHRESTPALMAGRQGWGTDAGDQRLAGGRVCLPAGVLDRCGGRGEVASVPRTCKKGK